MTVALVALVCRTADRTPGAVRGVQTLAPLIGKRLGVEPRTIGTPTDSRETRYDEDLRDSRGCLLEAGGQVEDALTGGRVPGLAAAGRSIARTPPPAAPRPPPDPRVLWLDAPRGHNTPQRPGSGPPGGLWLARACSGSTRTATTTRPRALAAATWAACAWRARAASGTPAWGTRSRPSGWCSPACATSTTASASCSSAATRP